MSSPSPLSRPGSVEPTRITTAPQVTASAAPPRSRGGGVALWVVAVLLVPLLALLVRYFTGFLGTAATFLGLVLAAIPFVIVWFAVRYIDRWEPPEPRRLLVFAVAWGAIAAVVIALGVDLLLTLVVGRLPEAFSAVVQAPSSRRSRRVSASCSSSLSPAGRSTAPSTASCMERSSERASRSPENVQYFAISYLEGGPAQVASTFFLRAVLSPFAHVMFTSLTGFAFGLAARRGLRTGAALAYGIPGLVGAIVLHGLWNGSATFANFFEVYAGAPGSAVRAVHPRHPGPAP